MAANSGYLPASVAVDVLACPAAAAAAASRSARATSLVVWKPVPRSVVDVPAAAAIVKLQARGCSPSVGGKVL